MNNKQNEKMYVKLNKSRRYMIQAHKELKEIMVEYKPSDNVKDNIQRLLEASELDIDEIDKIKKKLKVK